jgi:hypothetical protein
MALIYWTTQHRIVKQKYFVTLLIFIQSGAFKRRWHYSSLGDAEKVLQRADIAEHIHL